MHAYPYFEEVKYSESCHCNSGLVLGNSRGCTAEAASLTVYYRPIAGQRWQRSKVRMYIL